jgi:cellulose synthase/poly-beta-1,6-N-acetylglucosamine synthase-like glycosyltransferase
VAKHALFTVASLILNLFKFLSSVLIFPLESYSFITSLNILPATNAVTGCYTTSLLFGIGKRSVFKALKENPDNFKDLSHLADCDVDVSVTDKCK